LVEYYSKHSLKVKEGTSQQDIMLTIPADRDNGNERIYDQF